MEPSGLDYAVLVNVAGGLMLATGAIAGLVLILRLVRRGPTERPLPVDVVVAARTPPPPPPAPPASRAPGEASSP